MRSTGDAHRQVQSFLNQIGGAVGQRYVERYLGMLRQEFAPQRRQQIIAKRYRSGDAQVARCLAGARVQLGLRFLKRVKQVGAAQMEQLAVIGQRQAARGAVQQPHAEAPFQIGDQARHRRLGTAYGLGSTHETAVVDDRNKRLHFLEFIHCLVFRNKQSF